MEVDVYADLLFLINAGMDGLCLSGTARLLHRRVRTGRWLAGAVLGGGYAVAALFLSVGKGAALAVDVLACLVMCAVVFGERGAHAFRRLLTATAVYTALSMVMGGVMTALFNLCNRAGLADSLPDGGEGIGAWLFLAASLVGSVVSLKGGRLWRRSRTMRLCRVTLEVDGKSLSVQGLVDSGNLLRDPLGGRAVICLSRAAAERILSPAWAGVLASGGTETSGLRSDSDLRRLRLIPAGSATGGGLLPGFRPDRVTLAPEGAEAEEEKTVDAVIAVTAEAITGTEAMGCIEALVPAELM